MIKKRETDDKKQWFIYPANLRTKTLVIIALSALVIVSIFVSGYFIRDIPTSFIRYLALDCLLIPDVRL